MTFVKGGRPAPRALWVIAVALTLVIAGACAAGRLSVSSGGPVAGVGGCRLPGLDPVDGPAAEVFTGGPVNSSFVLDGGGLVVKPPPRGDKPSIPRLEAECTALAANEPTGNPAPDLGTGLSIGYGMVSVRDSLISAAVGDMSDVRELGVVSPKVTAPTPFRDRLAWVVINTENYVYHCPAMPSPSKPPKTPATRAMSYDYRAMVLDGRTGLDPLFYYESSPAGCATVGLQPPRVAVPVSQWSVPWRLISRDEHDYSATVAASVLPCDGYSPSVGVQRGRNQVTVLVDRPIGMPCGPAKTVELSLQADTVFDSLPALIAHAPTGLYLNQYLLPPGGPTTSPPTTPHPPIVSIGPQSSGQTINAIVGTVFFIAGPLPGPDGSGQNAVQSSNPAVVGRLGGGTSNEYKAWAPGQATMTIAKQSCRLAPPLCTADWVVHIRIT